MSLSPQKIKIALQAEIDKRIDTESPTKYDINFYVRKINRLENDLALIQDQLSSARIRLRKAEDFEIKYDLVLKQNNNLLGENDRLAKDLHISRVDAEKNRHKLEEELTRKSDADREKKDLQVQIESWKKRYHDVEELRLTETSQEASKAESISKRDLDTYRREAMQHMEKYEIEITQLRRQIEEKNTVEKVVGMKVDRIRKEKDEDINRLNNLIERQRFDIQAQLAEKNEQVEKLQDKYEKMFDMELNNIKVNLDNQDELFGIELSSLKETLGLKNDEINKLLISLKTQSDTFDKQKQQLKEEIGELRDRIYKNERQNEIEMYNVKQRLTKIHSVDIEAMEQKYTKLVETLQNEKTQLERLLKAKQEQLQLDLKQLERLKQQLHDKIKDRDHKIRELKERLLDTGAMNSNQMKVLHESFHKIESEKQSMATGYQNNIGFLDQQLKKMTTSLQLRQAELRTIQDELAFVKLSSQQDMRELQNKLKNERKQREADRERDRVEMDRQQDEWRTKQKDWRTRERLLQRQRQKQEREKKRLGFVVEEFEKDNVRLNSYIKQLDEALKRQLKKNQLSTLDTGGIRRQMVSELERQKNELQAIKKSEVDQIIKKYEIEISKLTNDNQRLQTELLTRTVDKENLESEVKKMEGLSKSHQKISKEKRIEFEKKMATLNSEIHLTQNLYQNFIEAKSRVRRQL